MTLTAGIPSRGINLVGTGTIIDDETRPPVLSIGSVEVREGDGFNRPVRLWVSLNAPATQLITVNYATQAGPDPSATAGTDYVAKTGTLTFKPGMVMKAVPLVLKGDVTVEGNESFSVKLSNPTNAILNDDTGEVSVIDDDSPSAATAEVSIADTAVYESAGLRKRVSMSFTVSLSKRPTAPVSISYTTTSGVGPGGATVGTDFVAKTGTLNFTPTQVAKVVTISALADTLPELDETFSVNLTLNSGPVTITDAVGVGTIRNDD
jgi:serralysin